jgi:hypothetical protein
MMTYDAAEGRGGVSDAPVSLVLFMRSEYLQNGPSGHTDCIRKYPAARGGRQFAGEPGPANHPAVSYILRCA